MTTRATITAWGFFAATVVVAVSGAVLSSVGAEGGIERLPTGVEAMFALMMLTFAGVGAVVASRCPANPIGWILCGAGLLTAAVGALEAYPRALVGGAPLPASEYVALAAALASNVGIFVPIVAVLLLFPDGRLPSPRWRPVAWIATASLVSLTIMETLRPGPLDTLPSANNPFGLAGLRSVLESASIVSGVVLLGTLVAGMASQILRLRRARGEERQQLKWFASAATLVGVTFLTAPLIWNTPGLPEWVWSLAFVLAVSSIPLGIGIAILKYRLYEIDRVISRTLAYALITAVLGVVYALGIVTLGQLFAPFAPDSQLAVAGSTLAVAAAFGPVRRRVQAVVDRRFNRARYDARQTVESFASRLRNEVNLEDLSGDLVATVYASVEPAAASLWLRSSGSQR